MRTVLVSLYFGGWGGGRGGGGLVEDREWNQSEYLASTFSSFRPRKVSGSVLARDKTFRKVYVFAERVPR